MNNNVNQCKFTYHTQLLKPEQCILIALPDSEYCLWHDKRSKENYQDIVPKLEDLVLKQLIHVEGFNLKKANLRGLTLKRVSLTRVNFENADLTRSDLRGSDISNSNFRYAYLRGSDLANCISVWSDFRGANLDDVNFTEANLQGSKLENCSLKGTIFKATNLLDTDIKDLFPSSELKNFGRSLDISPNPFTPKAGLRPFWFGGRDEAKKILLSALVKAKSSLPEHVVLLGDWAMGKTSLLIWLRDNAQSQNIWASYVPIPLLSIDTRVSDAISGIVEGISHGFHRSSSTLKNFVRSLTQFGFTIVGSGVQITRKIECQPITLFSTTLRSLWDDLKDKSKCLCILIDDVQNLHPGDQALSVIKQSLIQLTAITQMRILIVLSSTPEEWSKLTGSSGHTPIGRYFSTQPTLLTKLNDSDMIDVINHTLMNKGVCFTEGLIKKILRFANGHPYDLQIICNILYDAQFGGIVNEDVWDKSREKAERLLTRIITKRNHALQNSAKQQPKKGALKQIMFRMKKWGIT